jgi:4-amino-4-deoxy-L-arabinose transferase-like glycosyltransferase
VTRSNPHERRIRLLLAAGALVVLAAGVVGAQGPGVTWDELTYASAGYRYWGWMFGLPGTLSAEQINELWHVNHEHPPAAKIVYGLAGRLQSGAPLASLLTARHFAAALFALLVVLVGLLTARYFGRRAGVLAAVSLVLMPRVFGHGHLAALDAPVALAVLATTHAFIRAMEGVGRARASWAVAAGALWGVALLTKVNAFFVPLVLVPWAFWFYGRRAWAAAGLLIGLGTVVFFLGWPWLWPAPIERSLNYALHKTEQMGGPKVVGATPVPVLYLGREYDSDKAPWHYPLVMTVATVPTGLLLLGALGTLRAFRRRTGNRGPDPAGPPDTHSGAARPDSAHADEGLARRRRVAACLLASLLVYLLVFAMPKVPCYDGVRLFLPVFPLLACFVGIGAAVLWQWRGWLGRSLLIAVLLAPAAGLAWVHPCELSFYSAAVGGARGARALGFEPTYWGDSVTPEVMAHLNRIARPGATVDVRPDYLPFGFDRTLPWLRSDLRRSEQAPLDRLDYLIVFPRITMLHAPTRHLLETARPVRKWTVQGVPVCLLYDLRDPHPTSQGPNP